MRYLSANAHQSSPSVESPHRRSTSSAPVIKCARARDFAMSATAHAASDRPGFSTVIRVLNTFAKSSWRWTRASSQPSMSASLRSKSRSACTRSAPDYQVRTRKLCQQTDLNALDVDCTMKKSRTAPTPTQNLNYKERSEALEPFSPVFDFVLYTSKTCVS